MLEYINTAPLKIIIICIGLSLGMIIISINLKNPKRLFFILIFYIPLSFKSTNGSIAIYLIILLYIYEMFIFNKPKKNIDVFKIDVILVLLILLSTVFSIINIEDKSLFYFEQGKIRLSQEYLIVVSMLSNFALYSMVKKYIASKEDIIRALKFMVLSGFIATLAGYLQKINPENTMLFKYIIIAENPKWATRIAATMPGYELLSEYTAILLVFSIIHDRLYNLRKNDRKDGYTP